MRVPNASSGGSSSIHARGRKPGCASMTRASTGSALRRNSRAFRSASGERCRGRAATLAPGSVCGKLVITGEPVSHNRGRAGVDRHVRSPPRGHPAVHHQLAWQSAQRSRNKRRAPIKLRAPFGSFELKRSHAARARALGTHLDLVCNLLPTLEGVEVAVSAALVEEILLPVIGRDESKTAVRNDLLDGACRHLRLLCLELKATHLGPVRENRSLR